MCRASLVYPLTLRSKRIGDICPKLYRYYCTILKALFDHHPGLVHTFSNSVFPAVTFNLGPAYGRSNVRRALKFEGIRRY
ncbi:hypothetical protein B0H10DRAFT_2087302 [Mycena sp. CBHHK59/15]|nr:hypothetical protein B0H10DRAFT_2087302 [Mycena sp. CBHHK59/15]